MFSFRFIGSRKEERGDLAIIPTVMLRTTTACPRLFRLNARDIAGKEKTTTRRALRFSTRSVCLSPPVCGTGFVFLLPYVFLRVECPSPPYSCTPSTINMRLHPPALVFFPIRLGETCRAKRLLLRPILGPLVTKYLGTVVKKKRSGRPVDSLNVASYETAFYLTCMPVHALRQMWIMQVQCVLRRQLCQLVCPMLCVFLKTFLIFWMRSSTSAVHCRRLWSAETARATQTTHARRALLFVRSTYQARLVRCSQKRSPSPLSVVCAFHCHPLVV